MTIRSACVAATLAAGLLATPVAAATLFRLFGDANGDFTLPSPLVPSQSPNAYAAVFDTPASLNGSPSRIDLYFYVQASGGGFDLQDTSDPDVFFQFAGPALFSGPTSNPAFGVGTYQLTDFGGGNGRYTLVISNVPEPASWALLIAGFGLTGAGLRQRRHAAIIPDQGRS